MQIIRGIPKLLYASHEFRSLYSPGSWPAAAGVGPLPKARSLAVFTYKLTCHVDYVIDYCKLCIHIYQNYDMIHVHILNHAERRVAPNMPA